MLSPGKRLSRVLESINDPFNALMQVRNTRSVRTTLMGDAKASEEQCELSCVDVGIRVTVAASMTWRVRARHVQLWQSAQVVSCGPAGGRTGENETVGGIGTA